MSVEPNEHDYSHPSTVDHAKSDIAYVNGLECHMDEGGKYSAQNVRDLIGMVRWNANGLIEKAAAEQRGREKERAETRGNMFWDPDNPEAPMDTPFDEMGDWGRENGKVHEVWQGLRLPSIFVAQLPPAADADSDDEWTCEADTREAAQALLDAEKERRDAE